MNEKEKSELERNIIKEKKALRSKKVNIVKKKIFEESSSDSDVDFVPSDDSVMKNKNRMKIKKTKNLI